MGFWKKLFGLEKTDVANQQVVNNVVEYKVNSVEDIKKLAEPAAKKTPAKKPAAKKADAPKAAPAKKPAAKPVAKTTKKTGSGSGGKGSKQAR